jgi:methyl-accepting chemotaxis protein
MSSQAEQLQQTMAFFRTNANGAKTSMPSTRKANAKAQRAAGGTARVAGNVALSAAEPDEAQFTKFK